jgi:hypothetical protein
MARRVKLTDVSAGAPANDGGSSSAPNPAEFQRIIGEINRQKTLASEYQGSAGKLTRQSINDHRLDRDGFGFVMKLSKKDSASKQATIRAVGQSDSVQQRIRADGSSYEVHPDDRHLIRCLQPKEGQ